MDELALFAGVGGGLLATEHLLGFSTVAAVEISEFRRRVLLRRQRDGLLDLFPIWDDVKTFNGWPWRGKVDVITGGFPCQDISAAGKGEGLTGKSSGLWFEMLRIIGEVQPKFVFAENSPYLRTRGLGTIIKGLASLGYDCRWCVLGARHVGAPHHRKRIWLLAYSDSESLRDQPGRKRRKNREGTTISGEINWWDKDIFSRVDDGVPDRMERFRATGDAQVPAVAALAWQILNET